MKHLSETELSALADRALAGRERDDADRHLAECGACRDALAALEAQDRGLAAALDHDPGEAYFASFADRALERIRREGVTMGGGAAATDADARERMSAHEVIPARRPPRSGSWLDEMGSWLSGPRLAWVGATAAVVAAVGVVFMVTRETPMTTFRDTAIERRAGQVSGKAEAPRATAPPRAATPPASPSDRMEPRAGVGDEAAKKPRAEADEPSFASGPGTPSPRPPQQATNEGARDQEASTAAPRADAIEITDDRANAPTPPATALGKQSTKREALAERSRRVTRDNGEEVPVTPMPVPERSTKEATGFASPPPTASPPSMTDRLRRAKDAQRRTGTAPLAGSAPAPQPAELAAPKVGEQKLLKVETSTMAAATVSLCGAVHGPMNRPIAGATVTLMERGATATTDANGRYCITAPAGAATLTVMAVGFRQARRPITMGADESGDVTLTAVPVLGQSAGLGAYRVTTEWPPSVHALAASAEKASESALEHNTAVAFDSAASRWEKMTSLVTSGSPATTVHRNLADARFRAWKLSPTPPRAISAIAALSSYARLASGPERDRALQQLDQVRKR